MFPTPTQMIMASLRQRCSPALACLLFAAAPAVRPAPAPDWRELTQGSVIPSENYTDQPYIVTCDDGSWLCVLTTSRT